MLYIFPGTQKSLHFVYVLIDLCKAIEDITLESNLSALQKGVSQGIDFFNYGLSSITFRIMQYNFWITQYNSGAREANKAILLPFFISVSQWETSNQAKTGRALTMLLRLDHT